MSLSSIITPSICDGVTIPHKVRKALYNRYNDSQCQNKLKCRKYTDWLVCFCSNFVASIIFMLQFFYTLCNHRKFHSLSHTFTRKVSYFYSPLCFSTRLPLSGYEACWNLSMKNFKKTKIWCLMISQAVESSSSLDAIALIYIYWWLLKGALCCRNVMQFTSAQRSTTALHMSMRSFERRKSRQF